MTQQNPESVMPFKLKSVLYNVAFFLNGLLLFLLAFEERFVVASWLQPIGRLHPLVLHFPLVVLLIYAIWVILVDKQDSKRWHDGFSEVLLLIGVITAVMAAFSGFILSQEQGYEADALFWHKWSGVAISLSCLFWYGFLKYLPPWKIYSKVFATMVAIVLLVGGHLGGNLTHGEDFLTASFVSEQDSGEKVAMQDALFFNDLVKPVLEKKCYSCHNEQKSKGDLQMQTEILLKKGGKNGMLWDTTKADLGLLISRLHLGIDDKKHMPPRGKPQLTSEEIVLLATWVKSGSQFDQKVASLGSDDPVYVYAQKIFGGSRTEEQYDFDAASNDEILKLNTSYRLVAPLAIGSPALVVNFYNRTSFKSSDISDLKSIKDQIVSMDLSKMPLKDADLKLISDFKELRTLILNFTDLKGTSLSDLNGLNKLKTLSLSGTVLQLEQLDAIKKMPALEKVFVWSTGLDEKALGKLKLNKKIAFEVGFEGDTVKIALNPPIIINEEAFVRKGDKVAIKHQIPGVVLRYTVDGTEPDSVSALIYTKPLLADKNFALKVRAFKPGWYGSPVQEKSFILVGYKIDSVKLLTLPDNQYLASKDLTIIDGIKSDAKQGTGKWLGYRDSDFESMLLFDKTVTVQSLTISMFKRLNGFIFPPTSIEVWGGNDSKNLKLLKKLNPEIPNAKTENESNVFYTLDFNPTELRYMKVIAKPIKKLPNWHNSKGEKGWVFIDEVIVN